MIIIGAKGFAKEVLEVLHQLNQTDNVVFFDDVNTDAPEKLYGKFHCIKTETELLSFVEKTGDRRFTLGLGNPKHREFLSMKFKEIGLQLVSTISPKSTIGHYDVEIGQGVNCMSGSIITNSISIGEGCLINLNCTIGHDSILEEYVELSPGVHISGNCRIGRSVVIGTNATVLPKVTIGAGSIIGAGAVVTKDIPSFSLAVGVPAKVIESLSF